MEKDEQLCSIELKLFDAMYHLPVLKHKPIYGQDAIPFLIQNVFNL